MRTSLEVEVPSELSAGTAVELQVRALDTRGIARKNPEVHFKIGLSLYHERDYRAALGEFYSIVQDSPDSPVIFDALYYSGLAFAKLGQCKKAIAYFEALNANDSKAPKQYKTQAKKQVETLKKDKGRICQDSKSPA